MAARMAELEAQLPAKEPWWCNHSCRCQPTQWDGRIIHQVMPEYPSLHDSRVQGTVVLDTVVSVEGAVTQVKVVSGPEALSQAARMQCDGGAMNPIL